jgi:hypothetical protein
VLWAMWRHDTVFDPARVGLGSATGLAREAQSRPARRETPSPTAWGAWSQPRPTGRRAAYWALPAKRAWSATTVPCLRRGRRRC